MITYPLAAPDGLSVSKMTVTPQNAVSETESPYNYSGDTYDWGGERWQLHVSLPMLDASQDLSHEIVAWLMQMKSKRGTFLFPMLDQMSPRGVATGTPVVDGADQTGYTLNTKGWTPSTTGILKVGSWINLGSGANLRLHKLMQTADSDASGKAALLLWPKLRESPLDEATVTIENCMGHFKLERGVPYDITPPIRYLINFEAKEKV